MLRLPAQNDSLGYIYVESKALPAVKKAQAGTRDFFRNMTLLSLPLRSPENAALAHAKGPGEEPGLVRTLLAAWEKGEISVRKAARPAESLSYYDFIYGLLALQGVSPENEQPEVEWEWLEEQLDLIAEEGFSTRNSDAFFRIRYIRLIWFNPQTARGQVAVALIPYEELVSLLEQTRCEREDGIYSARDLLELRIFRANVSPVIRK
ncbi:MAG: hypothetical protein EAZ89_14830 [Bacteroidetes bacterium]|nr:MAG: hypothetical protein EAZ89_14830 [Bacteroidota bacterium]